MNRWLKNPTNTNKPADFAPCIFIQCLLRGWRDSMSSQMFQPEGKTSVTSSVKFFPLVPNPSFAGTSHGFFWFGSSDRMTLSVYRGQTGLRHYSTLFEVIYFSLCSHTGYHTILHHSHSAFHTILGGGCPKVTTFLQTVYRTEGTWSWIWPRPHYLLFSGAEDCRRNCKWWNLYPRNRRWRLPSSKIQHWNAAGAPPKGGWARSHSCRSDQNGRAEVYWPYNC